MLHPGARDPPGAVALFLISYLIWGYVLFPGWVAGLSGFDVYWLWKSWTIGYHVIKGTRIMKRFQKTDWRHEYEYTMMRGLPFNSTVAWDDVRHVVTHPQLQRVRVEAAAYLRRHGRVPGCFGTSPSWRWKKPSPVPNSRHKSCLLNSPVSFTTFW